MWSKLCVNYDLASQLAGSSDTHGIPTPFPILTLKRDWLENRRKKIALPWPFLGVHQVDEVTLLVYNTINVWSTSIQQVYKDVWREQHHRLQRLWETKSKRRNQQFCVWHVIGISPQSLYFICHVNTWCVGHVWWVQLKRRTVAAHASYVKQNLGKKMLLEFISNMWCTSRSSYRTPNHFETVLSPKRLRGYEAM